MGGARWTVAAMVVAVSLAGSAAAQDEPPDYDPVGVLVDALQTEAGQAFSAQFTAGELPYRLTTDPAGDLYSPTGEQPGHSAPHTDIIEVYAAHLGAGAGSDDLFDDVANGGPWCADSGFGSAGDIRTFCPPGYDGGAAFGGEGVFLGSRFATELPRPPPDELCEFVVWAFNPQIGPPFSGPFGETGDPADGMNVGVGARWIGDAWEPFALVNRGGSFVPEDPANVLAAIYGDYYALVLPPTGSPLGDLGAVEKINAYAFCASDVGNQFAPENHVADETEEIQTELVAESLTGIGVSVAPASPSPSPSPEPTPPVTETATPPIGIPDTEAAGDAWPPQSLLLGLLIGGGLVTVVGLLLWFPRRRDEDDDGREEVETELVEAWGFGEGVDFSTVDEDDDEAGDEDGDGREEVETELVEAWGFGEGVDFSTVDEDDDEAGDEDGDGREEVETELVDVWFRDGANLSTDVEEDDDDGREEVETELVEVRGFGEGIDFSTDVEEDDADEDGGDGPVTLGPTRTRERGPREEDTPTTPPPEEHDGDERCDWEVVLHVPNQPPRVLRPARGHRCCVYNISVRTKVVVRRIVGRGRQDGPDRLRLLDPGVLPTGLDVHTRSSVRTGPAGELSWMHGQGESTLRDDVVVDEPYWQRRSHEQPPDVALHVRYGEETTVEVGLDSECPGHRNTYSWEVDTDSRLRAHHECTNHGTAPCPVELTAAGWVDGIVTGDVLAWCGVMAGSDVDELERTHDRLSDDPTVDIGADGGLPPVWDSHDHVERDRADWSDAASDYGTRTVRGDSTQVVLASHSELDAGTIVPTAVHDTTDRVTAEISADVEHDVDLEAEMQRTTCEEGPCCGHGVCRCSPAFELTLGGGLGSISVEGRETTISRPTIPRVGVDHYWDVT